MCCAGRRHGKGRAVASPDVVVGGVKLIAALAAALALAVPSAERPAAVVDRVVDGDTIRMEGGVSSVRLLQIDAPELSKGECYGREAARVLVKLLPHGTPVALETDGELDRIDRYGRLLRYVFRGRLNVNLWLVERGAAAPYFYRGDRGRYAAALLAAAQQAKAAHVGLWRTCPLTELDPDHAIDARR